MILSPKVMQIALSGLRRQIIGTTALKNVARNSSVTTWNKDWKPGPYPRTEEERLAAAKKYNLIPEDYEPYPEEEGFGDYPMFQLHHAESRNPFEPYDFDVLKRNYGEPLHPDFDCSYEDRLNWQTKLQTPLWKQFIYLLSGVTFYFGGMYYALTHPPESDTIPKQTPYSGQLHYTFEAED